MTTSTGIRRLLAVFATACVLAGMTAIPAEASTALVTCTGTAKTSYSPGLTYTEQAVALNGQDTAESCISPTHPQLRSFIGPFSGTSKLSCLKLLGAGSGTQKLYWNGSRTSTSDWNWTSTPTHTGSVLVVVLSGPITSGVLEGTRLTQELVFTADSLDACGQPGGLTHMEGPSTWQFVDL